MNRKENSADVLSKNTTLRFKKEEYNIVKKRAEDAGMSFSNFCRQMTIKGYVQAAIKKNDLQQLVELRAELIAYRTNFSRIANYIKNKNPYLHQEVMDLKNNIQKVIDSIKL